jgi:hypothetical protein
MMAAKNQALRPNFNPLVGGDLPVPHVHMLLPLPVVGFDSDRTTCFDFQFTPCRNEKSIERIHCIRSFVVSNGEVKGVTRP